MRYFPLTDSEKDEIRKTLGIRETKELFSDIPENNSYYSLEDLPSALPEKELTEKFQEWSEKNLYPHYTSFLGGGAYNHFIPEVVKYLSSKGELLTPYTPYQPEVSQGSLQALFEYQTMISLLTGMDVANSSLYDGGTAAAEGLLLASRKSKKNRFLVASNLHPEYIEIINTYIQNLDVEVKPVAYDEKTGKLDLERLEEEIDENTGGIVFQSPNFFGVIESSEHIADIAHKKNLYAIQVITEAMSLPFLKPPGENGVDIVVGEAQSFGLPLSFGGPFLGFIAAKKDFLRQMPGRIVGETVDTKGRRGYVLTLSTREQHIKREKATSNICTNQAWCALRASIYLSAMGKTGLAEISRINHLNTAYFVQKISTLDKVDIKYKKDFFNEIVLEVKNIKAKEFLSILEEKKIIAGIPLIWFFPELENSLLINFTEMHSKADIDNLVMAIEEIR